MSLKYLSAILAAPLCLYSSAWATLITLTSTAVAPFTIGASSDTLSFNSGSVTSSTPGDIAFQTGSLCIAYSPIPAQIIFFSFSDTITLNGITNTVTIFGQDSVTTTTGTVTILAGSPVHFGNYVFTVDANTYEITNLGRTLPLTLTAVISPVPEPGSVTFLATGLGAGLLTLNARRRKSSL